MSTNHETLAIVATVASETEGHLLASILNEHEIPAVVSGGVTSQFRAETPGTVQVMVRQGNLAAARSILEERVQCRHDTDEVDEDEEAPTRQSRLTAFGEWSLLIGEWLAIAGILIFLAMGGNLAGGLGAIVCSLGIVLAILTRRWHATT